MVIKLLFGENGTYITITNSSGIYEYQLTILEDSSSLRSSIPIKATSHNVGAYLPSSITINYFVLHLKRGWNMVSLPVVPANNSVSEVLRDLDYYVLYTWDASEKRYVKPDVWEPGVGYWILVLEDTNVTIFGTPIESVDLSLKKGWNIIGSIWNKASLSTGPDYAILGYAYTWDPTGQRYVKDTTLNPGKAYWIFAFEDCRLKIKPA